MAAAVVTCCANSRIVEVLNLYNYEDWSLRVETYLIAEGLWDVVEATAKTPNNDETEYYRDWRMANAKALHAIQISCRTDVFDFISDIRMAKDAWETLAKRLKPKHRDVKGMAATLVPSVLFDLKALNKDNYEQWSFWVKTYLVAEDLWDIVEDTNDPPNLEDGQAIFMAWRKNNARALHVITIFCGEDAESCVRDTEMAKHAWTTLAKNFSHPHDIIDSPAEVNSEVYSDDDPNSNDGIAEEENGGLEKFFQMVRNQRWEDVREYIERHPGAIRADMDWGLTPFQYVICHVMVEGVKVLLPLVKKRDLDIPNWYCEDTALSLAIQNSDTDDAIEIVKCILEKDKKLLLRAVRPSTTAIPLLYALSLDKPKIAHYLYSVTDPLKKLKSRDKADIISTGLRMKHLDIPLNLLRSSPDLIIAKDHSGECPLIELAGTRAGLFPNVSHFRIWKRLIYHCIHIPPLQTRYVSVTIPKEDKDQGNQKQPIHKVKCFFGRLFTNLRNLSGIRGIYQMKFLHVRTLEILKIGEVLLHEKLNHKQRKIVEKALFQAVERGHAPFIETILIYNMAENRSWFFASTNEQDRTLFQFAAEQRQDKIFDLINTWFVEKERKEIIGRKDKFGNNMLHVVGKLSPLTKIDHIRGAALQMQYELQWFKKVERMATPKDLNCINSDGRTPSEEFTWNHRSLAESGEKSMKETATSSSAVSALIVTIMFAAALTVPGGINGNTGIPIYLHTKGFKIFIVADIISLCSSTTSVILFLGILLSRFAEQDFLTSLPTKLIIGSLTLFLSIGAMMIAFSSAIFIMLPGNPSIAISSCVLASFPIASFLWMQFPYLLEIIISTYGSRLHLIYQILKQCAQRIHRWISRRIRRLLNSVGTWCQSNPRANRCCI